MRTHAGLKTTSLKDKDIKTVITAIKDCCDNLPEFRYEAEKSLEYEKSAGSPACQIVQLTSGNLYAALAFSEHKQKNGKWYLKLNNIIPLTPNWIKSDEYNEIVRNFRKKFYQPLKRKDIFIKLEKVDELVLENIISGTTCRLSFQRYIDNQNIAWGNFSYHPGTTEHLDVFIVEADRYRCSIDLQALYAYMINIIGWSETDAKWVRNRIEIGLEILKMRRRF